MRDRGRLYLVLAVLFMLAGCGPGTEQGSATTGRSSTTNGTTATSDPPRPTVSTSDVPSTTASPTTTGSAATTTPPSRAPGDLRGTTIALDPGHNGRNWAYPEEINRPVDIGTGTKPCNTTGASTADGFPEATFAWEVAVEARRLLEALGATVVLTRHDNDGWGPCITERAAIANQAQADAAVSIHADGAAPEVRGFHVIRPLSLPGLTDDIAEPSARLAVAIRDAYLGTGIPPASYIGSDGLDERDDLGGLTLSDVPVVFLEAGNMRNPADAALLADPEFRRQIAAALVDGVTLFLGG